MARRKSKSKTRKVKRGKVSRGKVSRGKVSRKTMKRSKRKSSRKSKSRSKAHKVSNILSSTYGLAGIFKENKKGYKQQRVANYDPYKKKKSLSKSSKAAKDSFLAGIDSGPKKSKGSWLSHVKKVYEKGQLSQPGYKYKDAMQDAKKTW